MTRTMYDAAVLPAKAPTGFDIAAGYVGGRGAVNVWSQADWQRATEQSRWLLPIFTCWPPFGDAGADVDGQTALLESAWGEVGIGREVPLPLGIARALDVELSIAADAVGYVTAWCAAVKAAGDLAVIYTSSSVAHLFAKIPGAFLWPAEWNGVAHMSTLFPNVVATQYGSPVVPAEGQPPDVDVSLVNDSLPLFDHSPAHAPGGDTMQGYAIAPHPSGGGYWLVHNDGAVYAFGNAQYHGGMNGHPLAAGGITGIAAHPTGGGYWLVGADGGVFAFGNAQFEGSIPTLDAKTAEAPADPKEITAARQAAIDAGHPNLAPATT